MKILTVSQCVKSCGKRLFLKKFSQGSTKIPSYDPSIFLYYYFSFYDFKNNVKIYERDENEKKKLNIKKGNCDYLVLDNDKKKKFYNRNCVITFLAEKLKQRLKKIVI